MDRMEITLFAGGAGLVVGAWFAQEMEGCR